MLDQNNKIIRVGDYISYSGIFNSQARYIGCVEKVNISEELIYIKIVRGSDDSSTGKTAKINYVYSQIKILSDEESMLYKLEM